jgi:hypothetical protein
MKVNWRNNKVWGWFESTLQEIKIQGPKWIDCNIIRGWINFFKNNFKLIKSWIAIKN